MTIRSPDYKWDERCALESFTNVNNHRGEKLYQKLAALHYLLVVEPDVEIATDAIDVGF